jgi:hypothetical protein
LFTGYYRATTSKFVIIPKLTDEMRRALVAKAGEPIAVVDDLTNEQYALISKNEYCRLNDEFIRRELQVSIDQVARGEVSELKMDEILAEAHRRHSAQKS